MAVLTVFFDLIAEKVGVDVFKVRALEKRHVKDAQRGLLSADDFLAKLSSGLGVDKAKLEKAWEKAYTQLAPVNPEVVAIIKRLKKKHTVALLSNTIESHSTINKKRGLYALFCPVFLSNEVGALKPEKSVYKKLLKKLGAKPEECVFIDDREQNLKPAAALGMKTILFKNAKQLKQQLTRLKISV